MSTEQQRFVYAIANNPEDIDLRRIYADWLEENGQDDHAAEQRRMATQEWVDARRWLMDFGKEVGLDLARLVEAGRTGGLPVGYNFEPENVLFKYPEKRHAFWKHWEYYTGEERTHSTESIPFCCCQFDDSEDMDDEYY